MNEDKLIRMTQEALEHQRITKFWYLSKMHGCNEFVGDYLEDSFFTEQQEGFFAEYEAQLELDRVFGVDAFDNC